MLQPFFVPVRPRSSRSARSSVRWSGRETSIDFPLTWSSRGALLQLRASARSWAVTSLALRAAARPIPATPATAIVPPAAPCRKERRLCRPCALFSPLSRSVITTSFAYFLPLRAGHSRTDRFWPMFLDRGLPAPPVMLAFEVPARNLAGDDGGHLRPARRQEAQIDVPEDHGREQKSEDIVQDPQPPQPVVIQGDDDLSTQKERDTGPDHHQREEREQGVVDLLDDVIFAFPGQKGRATGVEAESLRKLAAVTGGEPHLSKPGLKDREKD